MDVYCVNCEHFNNILNCNGYPLCGDCYCEDCECGNFQYNMSNKIRWKHNNIKNTDIYRKGWYDGQNILLSLIEEKLIEKGKDIKDYTNPRKSVTRIGAIFDAIFE